MHIYIYIYREREMYTEPVLRCMVWGLGSMSRILKHRPGFCYLAGPQFLVWAAVNMYL